MKLTHGQCLTHRELQAFLQGQHPAAEHCPACRAEGRGDSPLNIDLKTTMFDPKTQQYSVVRAAFCVSCEFVVEF